MYIEAVTVSVGCGDFLAVTLEENLQLVDDLLVITSEGDKETQDVCRKHSVRFIKSEDFRRGGPFNKARLIQRGMDNIGAKDWILHIDSDIILPRQFKRLLEVTHADERFIYGADRRMLVGFDEWERFKEDKRHWDVHSYECYAKPRHEYPFGTRWASTIHGYCPIGYFQLFHGNEYIDRGMHQRVYPIAHGNAARTDVQFSLQWDRNRRALLPEIQLLHLESEPAKMGANWQGRVTPPFKKKPPPPKHHPEPPKHHPHPPHHPKHPKPYC